MKWKTEEFVSVFACDWCEAKYKLLERFVDLREIKLFAKPLDIEGVERVNA